MPAAARVHRRHQLDARGEGDVRVGARDGDPARLDRLAQGVEHRAAEFGELVEEQYAEVGQADLAWPHAQAATGERRHRGRMVRAAERARADQPAAGQLARDARHHRHLERLGRRQLGEDAGQAGGEQRLARAGRAYHQQIMATSRRDLERALGDLLALDLLEVRPRDGRIGLARGRRRELRAALEVADQREQIGCGDHLDPPRPRRLGALGHRTDQPAVDLRGVECGEQHARRGRDPPVEPEFADRDIVGKGLGIDDAHRAEQRQRDRQVEMRTLLGQIGGRQVDDDPLGRQRQPDRAERAAHPLATFGDGFIRQPDDEEVGQAGQQLHLHLDRARLQPEKRHGRDDRDHRTPCFLAPADTVIAAARLSSREVGRIGKQFALSLPHYPGLARTRTRAGRRCPALRLGGREQVGGIAKRLEFERIARGIAKEHRRLLARLAGETDMRRDSEARPRRLEPRRERMPVVPLEHDAEMRHRHVVPVDRIDDLDRRPSGIEMRDDLVAVEIEIDPRFGTAALAAAEQPAIEFPRGIEIVDGKGEVERR